MREQKEDHLLLETVEFLLGRKQKWGWGEELLYTFSQRIAKKFNVINVYAGISYLLLGDKVT